MDNALEKFNPGVLAGIIGKEALATVNDQFAGGISGGEFLPQLSIRGNRLRLRMDGEETVLKENSVEVYLITSRPNVSKTFYVDGYAAGGENKAPDCSSADGIYPDANVESPQAVTCQICPNAAWGSKITQLGKKGKACSDYKLVVLALTAVPDKAFALRIPAASLKPFSAYIQKLNMAGVPANAARTKVSLGDTEFPSLLFDFVGTVDTKETYETLQTLAESSDVLNAVKIAPRAQTEPTNHSAEQPVVAAVTEAAQPAVEEVAEEAPEQSGGSLAELLGSKPKAAGKKGTTGKKAAPKAEPAPEPVETTEAGETITSLDGLLSKLKKK